MNKRSTLSLMSAALLAVASTPGPHVPFRYREPHGPVNRKSRLGAIRQSVRDDKARKAAAVAKRERRMARNRALHS